MLCRLCGQNEAIQNSHVIPQFVFRAIKSDSPTGFFRNSQKPNKREQDGDKQPLLCLECENRFSVAENCFAQNVFFPFHENDQDHFSYGPWLHYFLTSLAWRTLILDMPDLEADQTIPNRLLAPVRLTLDTMQRYLLGATHLADSLRNHALVWTGGEESTAKLASANPNVMVRRSAGGYSLIEKRSGYAGVIHNLAGFITLMNIKGNPKDNWVNTRIDPLGGHITQPQRVSSWIMHDLLEVLMDSQKTVGKGMSEKQKHKIQEGIQSNPTAPALRHAVRDAQIKIIPPLGKRKRTD